MPDTIIERMSDTLQRLLPAEAFATLEPSEVARAILHAMRAPTEAMLKAAEDVDFIGPSENDSAGEWRAMIDAALAEEG